MQILSRDGFLFCLSPYRFFQAFLPVTTRAASCDFWCDGRFISLDFASAKVMSALVERLSIMFSMCGIREDRRISLFASLQDKKALNLLWYELAPEEAVDVEVASSYRAAHSFSKVSMNCEIGLLTSYEELRENRV